MFDAWGQPMFYPLIGINAPVSLKISILKSSLKDIQDKKQRFENDLKLLNEAAGKIQEDISTLERPEEMLFFKTMEKAKELFDKGNLSEDFLNAYNALKKAVE